MYALLLEFFEEITKLRMDQVLETVENGLNEFISQICI